MGFVRFFAKERVVTWSFPNKERGVAQESKWPGGFKFDPNVAWANVQAIAFLHSSSKRNGATGKLQADRSLQFQIVPASLKRSSSGFAFGGGGGGQASDCDGESDGCTGLHWLDGSIWRPCCDDHDRCFERDCTNPCTRRTWIFFWERWECTLCNAGAILCAATGGGSSGGYCLLASGCDDQSPTGNYCSRDSWSSGWCPAECSSCT